MAANEMPPIVIELQARTAAAKAELASIEAELKKLGNTTEKSTAPVQKMGGAFRDMAKGLVGLVALGQVVNYLKEAGKAAAEDATSTNLLNRQLEISARLTQQQTGAVENQITQLSLLSGVYDDNIRQSLGVFVRANGDATKSLEMESVALDIAAGTGKDLATVTQAMAKAQDGNTKALQMLVPGIKNASDQMGFLKQQFAGAAETAANSNPYLRLNVAFDSLKETIGSAVIPFVRLLADWLAAAVPKVQAFFDALRNPTTNVGKSFLNIVAAINTTGAALTRLFNTISGGNLDWLGGALDAISKIFDNWTNMLGNLAKTIALFKKGDWLGGIMSAGKLVGPGAAWESFMTFFRKTHHVKTTLDWTNIKFPDLANLRDGGDTQKQAESTLKKSLTQIFDRVMEAQKKFNADLTKLQEDYGKKIADIQKQYQQKLIDVINQSKNLLRDAFAQATAIDVGAMFAASFSSNSLANTVTKQVKDGLTTVVSWWGSPSSGGGVAGLLDTLQKKLAASKELSDNAAKLAGAGFSQNFIDQILGQGSDLGNQMASAILAADPETQAALKKVFEDASTISAHGVDDLATKIYNTQGLATEALKTLYATTEADFATALSDAEAQFISDSNTLYQALQEQLATANKDLKTAISDAADAMGISVDAVTKKYAAQIKPVTDAIQSVDDAAQKAVKNAQDAAKDLAKSAYADTMDAVAKQASKTSTDLANAIAQLNAARAALGVAAPKSGPTAEVTTPKIPIPFSAWDAMDPATQQNYTPYTTTPAAAAMKLGSANTTSAQGLANLGAAAGFTVNAPVTVQTNADPIQIQTAIINGVKLNVPAILPAALAGQMGAM